MFKLLTGTMCFQEAKHLFQFKCKLKLIYVELLKFAQAEKPISEKELIREEMFAEIQLH